MRTSTAIQPANTALTSWSALCRGWMVLLVLTCGGWMVRAQPIITAPKPASTNQPDPLSAFMITQPPVDTESPVTVSVQVEPRVIAMGQTAVYRVLLNVMEQSIEWPDNAPRAENCEVRKGASGQFLQNLGSAIVPQTTFLYHLTPGTNGLITVPAFHIRARGEYVEIPAAQLTVLPEGAPAQEPAQRIILTANGDIFYVGQSVELRAVFPGKPNGTVRMLTQAEVVGDNLIVDRNFRTQRIETRVTNGVSIPTFIFDTLATPMRSGRTEVIAQGMEVGNSLQSRIMISGQPTVSFVAPSYKLVDSDPLELNILSLPADSELSGFTGAIGSFSIDRPTLSTNRVQAGDLLTLSVTLRGQGNLERVLPPKIAPLPQWQVFQASKENALAAIVRQRGFVTFEYNLIPLDASITATPAIPFCYFDPETRQYVDLTIQPIPVWVTPSATGRAVAGESSLTESRSLLQDLIAKSEEPKSLAPMMDSQGRQAKSLRPAHQQTWFAAVQVVPAGLLGGLWFWDRRRRYLAEHPEVVIRRRAQNAIRRHARGAKRAARRSDAQAFLQHAIQGFREAGAPGVKGEPRALVRGDVLNSIPARLRTHQVSHVVSILFDAANQWRFGEVEPDKSQLLGLASEVDMGLKQLKDAL